MRDLSIKSGHKIGVGIVEGFVNHQKCSQSIKSGHKIGVGVDERFVNQKWSQNRGGC